MKIGIISDTHGNEDNLDSCLTYLKNSGINTIIHCGDLGGPAMVQRFKGIRLILVYGNTDKLNDFIRMRIDDLQTNSYAGLTFEETLAGRRFFIAHGHREEVIMDAILSGKYDYVIHGHTHACRNEHHKHTRILNPGALGGTKHEPRSFMLLDLAKDELLTIELSSFS